MNPNTYDLYITLFVGTSIAVISGLVGLYGGTLIERFKRKERYREKAYDSMVKAASALFYHTRMAIIAGNHFSDNVNDEMWRIKFIKSLNNLQLAILDGAIFQEEETFLKAVKIFDLLDHFAKKPESQYPTSEIQREAELYFQLLENKVGLRRLTKDLEKIFETKCQRYKRYWIGIKEFTCHPIKTSKVWIEKNC